uniref:lamin tail domain-containing protein n=1 Tax=Candidatus Electronema sp. TaxID=2698783 RepID=UPI004056C0C2
MIKNIGALSLLSFTACFATALSAQAATPIFINEIHYDNAGADINEFVEITGPSGTDFSGWSVVFYNGDNGLTYATKNLVGTLLDASNGMGMIAVYQIGIQNGPPDGLALVDNTNKVVQFLSYEGTLTAADGPANGMTSTDIRVSQTGATSGDSLQLTGTGRVYEDFTWADTAPATPGTVNTGQVFPKVASSAHSSLQGIRFLLLK